MEASICTSSSFSLSLCVTVADEEELEVGGGIPEAFRPSDEDEDWSSRGLADEGGASTRMAVSASSVLAAA